VVGLGGLELRAKHAVVIEPVSRERSTAAILRSNDCPESVVPDNAVVTEGNIFGPAAVLPYVVLTEERKSAASCAALARERTRCKAINAKILTTRG
jgi:hypothetical protein